MRSFLIIALTCIFICSGVAQQKELDSSLQKLTMHPAEDTTRMKLLYEVAWVHNELEPGKGLLFAEELIVLAKKLKHINFEAKGYFSRGINYWSMGRYSEAQGSYRIAKKLFETAGAAEYVGKTNNSMAIVYQSMSDYSTALEIHFGNLRLYEKLRNTFLIAQTCGNIGLVYKYLGKNDKAIEYQQKAAAIHEKLGNVIQLADAYNNIGTTYENAGNPKKALEYYKREFNISRPINYTRGIASSFSNMGTAYIALGKYNEAYGYLQMALPIYKRNENKLNEAMVQKSIGEVYLAAGNDFFIDRRIPVSKRYGFAINYFDSSLRLFGAVNNIAYQAAVLKLLAGVYEAEGNFQRALQAHKEYAILKDSIFSDKTKEHIAVLETKYVFEKREDSIKAKTDEKAFITASEIRRQATIQKLTISAGTLLVLAAIVSFIFYKKRRDSKQRQLEAEFKTEVTDTEMKALRAQMNPHFIFNSLNSISDYIAKNDTTAANRYLNKFAKLMRMILENSEQKEVTLADDLKALELYMQLEALRMNNKFSYEITVDDTVDIDTIMVPPLILQPFVENSIWHGIARKEGPGKIWIIIKKSGDDMINCIVEDNGAGRQRQANIESFADRSKTSLGMKITQARIDILNKLKNTKAVVELSDLTEGVRVKVKLPLARNF